MAAALKAARNVMMTTAFETYRRQHDSIDAEARRLVREYLEEHPEEHPDDTESERRLRAKLAQMVLDAGIPQKVVFGSRGFSGQRGEDVLEDVIYDIVLKICGVRATEKSNSTLDLSQIADGSSLIGWARELMKMTALHYNRQISNGHRLRWGTPLGDYTESGSRENQNWWMSEIERVGPYWRPAPRTPEQEDMYEAIDPVDRIAEATGRNLKDLKHAAALILLRNMEVLGRPVITFDLRSELDVQVRDRPSLPFESLTAWIDQVRGTEGRDTSVSPAALRFWDGFTMEEAQLIWERGARVAALVMLGFIQGAIRPKPEYQEALMISIGAELPECLEGRARDIVDSVIVTHCSRITSDGRRLAKKGLSKWSDARISQTIVQAAEALKTTPERLEERIVRDLRIDI